MRTRSRLSVALVIGASLFGAAQPARAAGPYQLFLLHAATPLVGDDFDYAVADWNGDRVPDLFAIKRLHTGSGRIEVHILSGASNYQQFLLHVATPLAGDDFDYAVADWNRDGVPDLVAIKRTNTGSGRIEVHILSGTSQFQQFLLHTATPLVGDDFDYVVGDWNAFGTPDLVAVKRLHAASGTTELHVLSGESTFQTFLLHTATPLVGDDFAYALTDWDFDPWPDLVAVKRTNTGSNTIEAHILSRNAQAFALHTGTPLTGDDFDYAFADYDGDHAPDLFAIKRRNTGSGRIEVHVLGAPTPAAPAAPGNVSIAGQTTSSITVRWTDNATGYHGIRLERAAGSQWTTVWNAYPYSGQPTMTMTDYQRPAGSTSCYRVVAENSATRLSSASPTVCGTTAAAPPNLYIPQGGIYETELDDPYTGAPALLRGGDPFSIAWDECNNGGATAGAHETALLLRPTGQSWVSAGTAQVPAIGAGGCRRASMRFPGGLAADQYDAGVVLDSGGAVAEASEADNTGLMGFNILSF
jgi:FG-GAP-like repeat/CARDB